MRADEQTKIATPDLRRSISGPFGLPWKRGRVATLRRHALICALQSVVSWATPLVLFAGGIHFLLCLEARPAWVCFGFLLIALFFFCTVGEENESPVGSGVAVHQKQDLNKILGSQRRAKTMLPASGRKSRHICAGLLLWEARRWLQSSLTCWRSES